MKRCPECRRDYTDETLNYCLDDGAALLDGPGTADQPTAIISGGGEDRDLATRRFSATTADTDVLRVSDAARSAQPGLRKKFFVAAAAAGIVALITLAGYVAFRRDAVDKSSRAIRLERVTTDGKTSTVGISPDGKYAVYNVDSGGVESLWTHQIATASPVQIIPPAEGVEYSCLLYTSPSPRDS